MRDRLDAREDFGQRLVGQRQRIAAGQDHLADFGMIRDIGQRRLQRLARVAAADRGQRFLAEAEPAIDRALIGREQQHPVGMAMRQPRHRAEVMVGDRIVKLALRLLQFVGRRDDLRADRIGGVVPVDQVEIGFGDAHLVVRGRGLRRRALARRQRQGSEIAHMAHALADIVLPGGVGGAGCIFEVGHWRSRAIRADLSAGWTVGSTATRSNDASRALRRPPLSCRTSPPQGGRLAASALALSFCNVGDWRKPK